MLRALRFMVGMPDIFLEKGRPLLRFRPRSYFDCSCVRAAALCSLQRHRVQPSKREQAPSAIWEHKPPMTRIVPASLGRPATIKQKC